jgi:hypothetical protein
MCAFGPDGMSLGSRLLSQEEAVAFASAINRVELQDNHPRLPHTCPLDNGRMYVLAFAYRRIPAADLWWHASGCQWLDNGTRLAAEGGNPSFYTGFMGAAALLHA